MTRRKKRTASAETRPTMTSEKTRVVLMTGVD
jgi:hypothetical protein